MFHLMISEGVVVVAIPPYIQASGAPPPVLGVRGGVRVGVQQGVRHRPVQTLPGTLQYSTVQSLTGTVQYSTVQTLPCHQSSLISINLVKTTAGKAPS